jgi:hypothetical protein
MRLDHGHPLWRLLGGDDRHVALDDGSLLARDGGERVAEKLHVIHAERRDDACKRRLDHIGGIEPPAEPDFEQEHIGRMLRVKTESGGRLGLEKGQRLAGIGLLDALERGVQFVIADQPARETEALAGRSLDQLPLNFRRRRFVHCPERAPGTS